MTLELRDRARAEAWLAAGLCLTCSVAPTAAAFGEAAPWLVAALSEGGAIPPPGVVADLGHLLTAATSRALDPSRELPSTDGRLRAAVRSYEDQVLGRLAGDPRFAAAADAVARLSPSLRPQAVGLLASQLARRVAFAGGAALSPSIARRLAQRPAHEVVRDGFAALRDRELIAALADGYQALALAAQRSRALVGDDDVFALENLAVLGGASQRVAIAQIVSAAEDLERALPARVKRRARPAGSRAATALEEESAYPIGGFSSMTTSGSIENLVTSELVYMDDDPASDLFDLRYVEGELLYYSRDESILVRRRRVIYFVLRPELAELRRKDRGARYQRLVLALGLLLCAVRRASAWLTDEALAFRVLFLAGDTSTPPLEEERGLLELLLREWRDKGVAEVSLAPDLDAALSRALADAKSALVDLVILSARDEAPPERANSRVRVSVLSFEGPLPSLRRAAPAVSDSPPGGADEGWARAGLELLHELL